MAGAQNDDLAIMGLAQSQADQSVIKEKKDKNEYTVEGGYVSKQLSSEDEFSSVDHEVHPDAPTEEEKATLRREPDALNFKSFLM